MYAVIFKAEIKELNDEYSSMALQLRNLALQEYACIEFTSVTEGMNEITISYWKNLEDIKKWKQDPKHLIAQDLGRKQFYQSHKVQIVEILREYQA